MEQNLHIGWQDAQQGREMRTELTDANIFISLNMHCILLYSEFRFGIVHCQVIQIQQINSNGSQTFFPYKKNSPQISIFNSTKTEPRAQGVHVGVEVLRQQ